MENNVEEEDYRERKNWFVVLNNKVIEAEGLDCLPGNPKTWWFPSLGYSMDEGYHVFATRGEARRAAIKELQGKIATLQKALDKILSE